jgi:hypothetical protein
MKSPFPGMDPYLEQHWRDVHHNLITFLQGALNEQLPEGLIARVEDRVFLESEEGAGRMPAMEPVSEGYLEIIDVSCGNRIVTVIEVLSLSNKTPGDARRVCQQEQRKALQSGANLAEIDLLRAGQSILVPPDGLPPNHQSPYAICVRRANRLHPAEVYPVKLTERLPRFALPLRPKDSDLALDLQPLIEDCYQNGRYGLMIDYKDEPEPPLGPAEARWADELLKAAEKR